MHLTIPWLVLAVLLVGVWLILLGAGVALSSTATLVFGIVVVICAVLAYVGPNLGARRPVA